MKLHLPTGLRKALLACLTVFALPVTTLASASSALGASALVAFAISNHAFAASDIFEEPDYWEFAAEKSGDFTSGTTFNIDNLLSESGSDNSALIIRGFAGYQYTLTGGSANIDLKFIKTKAGGKSVIKAGSGTLVANNVFFTGTTTANNNNLYQILGGDTNLLSGIVGTIYVQQTGLLIQAAQNMQAGFSIGSAVRTGSDASTSVLQITANVTTTGSLEVQQDTGIDIVGATFTVSELTGEGDLKLGVTAAGNGSTASAGTLVLSNGGDRYGGALTFAGTSAAAFTVQLGNDSILNVTGIKGSYGSFSSGEDSVCLLRISGSDGSASNISLAKGVVLVLRTNASQIFEDSSLSEVNLINGGTLTLNGTSSISQLRSNANDGSSLILGESAHVTIANVIDSGNNVSSINSLSLGNASTLDLTGNSRLSITTLSVAEEGTATLRLSLADLPQITLGAYEGGTLLIELADDELPEKFVSGYEHDLFSAFDSTWNIRLAKEYKFGRMRLTLNEGVLSCDGFNVNVVWNGGEAGMWRTNGSGWDDGEAPENAFLEGDRVVFDAAASSVYDVVIDNGGISAGRVTVRSGADWVFSGSGDFSADAFIIESGNAEIAGSGAKALGSISVAAGSEFIISNATGWGDSQSNVVTGGGALVYKGLTLSGGEDVYNLIKATLKNSATKELAALRLRGSDIMLGSGGTEDGADLRSWLGSVSDIYVEAGSSIGIGSPSMNNYTDATRITLHLAGNGLNGKGALYLSGNRTVVLNIKIEDGGATINTNGSQLELTKTITNNGQTITKIGNGKLYLNGATLAGSGGVLDMQAGELILGNNAQNYEIKMSGTGNTTMTLNGNYTVSNLYGNAGATLTATAARTLTISNTAAVAATDKAYAGTIAANVTVAVNGGYWNFAGTANGALSVGGGNLVLSGGSINNGLTASSGSVKLAGAVSISSATLNLAAATLAVDSTASLSIAVAGYGSTTPALTLTAAQVATLSGLSSITLTGNSLSFDTNGTLNLLSITGSVSQSTLDTIAALITNELAGDYAFRLGEDGILRVVSTNIPSVPDDFVWNGGVDGTWSEGGTGWVGSDDLQFAAGKAAIFRSGSGGSEVTVDEAGVSAGAVSIESGTDWVFSGGALSISGDLTVGSEESAAEAAFENTVSLAGDIILLGEDSSVSFASATLGTEASEISGDGHVVFTSLSRAAAFTGTGLTISGGATVEINNTTAGNKNLGGVHIGSGCTVILNPNASLRTVWGDSGDAGNSYFYGEGSLVLAGTGHDASGIAGGPNNIIGKTLKAGSSIAHVYLGTERSNISMAITANNNASFNLSDVFDSITNLHIANGSALSLSSNANALLKNSGHVLHIVGTGRGDTSNNAALNITCNTTIAWDVKLSGAATIHVGTGAVVATVNGAFIGNSDYLFTKKGAGTLKLLGSVRGGSNVTVQDGTLLLDNAATDGTNLTFGKVNLSSTGSRLSAGGRSGGETGNAVWVGSVAGSGQLVAAEESATLKLSNAQTETSAAEFTGTTAAALTTELTSGAWKFGGTANGALSVSGGSLILTGGSLNGGLTATGGMVKLAGAVTLGNTTVSLTGATLSVENSASLSIAVAGYRSEASVLSLTADQLSTLSGLTSLTLTNTAWAADYSLNLFNLNGGSISADLLASLKELISLEGLDATLTWDLSDTGMLSISAVAPPPASELVWVDGNGTWSAAGTDARWADDAVFSEYADVTFGSDGATGGTVQIVGDEQHHMLSAGNVNIAHGTFTFDFGEGNVLSLMDMTSGSAELTVNSGATLVLVGERSADGETSVLSVMGRIVLNGTLEIGSADVDVTITECTGALANEGCITGTNAGAVFRLNYETDGVSDLEGITFSQYAGSVQISAGSFNLDSQLGSIGGKVVVDGSGSLQIAADTNKTLELGREAAGAALTLGAEGVTLSGAISLLSDTTITGHGGEAATLSGALDGGGNNLTLSGGEFALTGTLSYMSKLTVSSNTVAALNYSGNSSAAVFTEVALASGELKVGSRTGGVVIGSLSGSGTVHAAAESATLKLVNSLAETNAAEFTGAIDAAVTTELASGAWKFSGTANGALRVSGGSLTLAGSSLNGGLMTTGGTVKLAGAVSLGNATVNLAGAALSVENGVSLSIAVAGYQSSTAAFALTAEQVATLGGSGVQITLTGVDGFDTGWTMQLLDIVSGTAQQSDLDALVSLITNGADLAADDLAFALSKDGVLSIISTYVPPVEPDDRWVWKGDDANTADGMVWSGDSDNWNQTDGDTPNGKDVIFRETGSGNVFIKDTVSPRSVWVQSGTYEFTADSVGSGGLNIGSDATLAGDGELSRGELAVGSGNSEDKAELKLSLKNTRIDKVSLLEGGTLTLNHAEALTKGTEVVFSGGELAYEAISAVDISAGVSTTDGNIVRIRVGAEAVPHAHGERLRIVWGNERQTRAGNSGIRHALTVGIEKTGVDTFALEWSESADARLEGSVRALQGTLEYVLHAADRTVTFAGAPMQIGGNGADACVIFSFAAGAEGSMALGKAFTGSGTAQIGSVADSGTYLLNADNSAFAGSIRLAGSGTADAGTATAAVAGALGGARSTLVLAGRSLRFGESAPAIVSVGEIVAEAGSVTYIGGAERNTANEKITLTAPITGSGTLANARGGFAHTITGDLSAFTGSVVAGAAGAGSGAASTWALHGAGGFDLQANFSGTGSIVLDYADGLRLTGRIGADDSADNSVSLKTTEASGRVVIADVGADGLGKNSSTGSLVGEFYLGDAKNAGTWAGQSVDGYFELANGWLLNPITTLTEGSRLHVKTAGISGGATVNAGGTDASLLGDIVIHAGGHLSGVSGTLNIGGADGLTSVWLFYGAENVGNAAGAASTSYLMDIDGGARLAEADGLVLDFSAEGFVDVLKEVLGNGDAWLHTVYGGLSIDHSDYACLLGTEDPGTFDGDSLPNLLRNLGLEIKAVRGGDIILTGDVSEVYLVLEDGQRSNAHDVTGYNVLSDYKATVVDEGQTLTLTLKGAPEADSPDALAGGAVVNNLVGLAGSTLHVRHSGRAEERVSLVLSNESREIHRTEGFEEVCAQNTTFKGTISGDVGVDLIKTGAGTLTIGDEATGLGGLQLQDGDVSLRAGALRLVSEQNTADSLTFAGEEDTALILSGEKTSLSLKSVYEAEEGSGAIYLQQGAELVVTDSARLANTVLTAGEDATGGTLTVASGAKVALTSGAHAQLVGVAAEIESDAVLNVGSAKGNTLTGLTGSGELVGRYGAELVLTGKGSSFSGTLSGEGELVVSGGASFSLAGASGGSAGVQAWTLHNRGSLVIDITSSADGLWFEELTLGSASTTTLLLDTDRSNTGLLGGDRLTIEQGAKLIIESIGENALSGSSITLAGFDGDEAELRLAEENIILRGNIFLRYTAGNLHYVNGQLKLDLIAREGNAFITPGMEKNSRAGADMVWELTDPASAGWSYTRNNPETHLAGLAAVALQAYDDGQIDSLAGTFAAVAGASTGVLSSALSQDVQRQLSALRNRSAIAESSCKPADSTGFHLWLTGETAYHKLDADGMAPGFTLNGWGGSVGAELEVSNHTMLGIAISAMYNDLKTDSADGGKGDMDTTYLSAYARTINGAWTHTFIASVGMADVSLNRTVSYGRAGSYKAHGSTDGFSVGAMYEVGYSFMLNRTGSTLLQPVFNVQCSHASLSGYTESGTDAALRVDGLDQTHFTLGLGTRLQSAMGENVFNRLAVFEARALVKVELGDRSGTASTALVRAKGSPVEVEGAKVGSVGIELGAGFCLPVGRSGGALFMDAAAEFRSGYSGANAAAGYRISF